jgi:hypothetical protein
MRTEFSAVHKLELPITYLQVWQKGQVAWFAMELDYIRYLSAGDHSERMVIALRETGVLERRDGRWILVAWHESGRQPDTGLGSPITYDRGMIPGPRRLPVGTLPVLQAPSRACPTRRPAIMR